LFTLQREFVLVFLYAKMKSLTCFVALVGLYNTLSVTAMAGSINFSNYEQFNTLIFNDFYGDNSDVEGRLAVGGNAWLNNYSVNEYRSPGRSGPVHNIDSSVLSVAGDLHLSNSLVSGKASVGGAISLTNAALNDLTGQAVNFNDAYSELSQTAINLADLTVNTSITSENGKLRLRGDSTADVQVFELTSTLLSSAWGFDVINIDIADTIIFNISGSSGQLSGANFYNYDSIFDAADLGSHSENIIFNFYQANSLHIDTGVWGSILAVDAEVNCGSGVVWGQVYAQSWGSQVNPCRVQVNYSPFNEREVTQNTIAINEPASAFFIFSVLAFLYSRRQKAID
jgi:choice-of-anchor A domain-containing protein